MKLLKKTKTKKLPKTGHRQNVSPLSWIAVNHCQVKRSSSGISFSPGKKKNQSKSWRIQNCTYLCFELNCWSRLGKKCFWTVDCLFIFICNHSRLPTVCRLCRTDCICKDWYRQAYLIFLFLESELKYYQVFLIRFRLMHKKRAKQSEFVLRRVVTALCTLTRHGSFNPATKQNSKTINSCGIETFMIDFCYQSIYINRSLKLYLYMTPIFSKSIINWMTNKGDILLLKAQLQGKKKLSNYPSNGPLHTLLGLYAC